MLSSWERIEWRPNSIGFYGFDVIIDSDHKMWLLEINKSPTLEYSTRVTTKLVPKMLDDMVKVVADFRSDRSACTGDYELIYESPFIKEK